MNDWKDKALAMYELGATYGKISLETGKDRECVRAYIRRHSPVFALLLQPLKNVPVCTCSYRDWETDRKSVV